MSIFCLNYLTGNDANDGSSWALAWKSITSGALAARIAPGDVIRIAKTPDPTSIGNAAWDNLSKIVTLVAAKTAEIDMCATAWTPESNVTASTSATRKEGSLCATITVGTSFVDGLIAHKTIPETNFSGYQQISLWMRSTVATTALKICLCSDTAGAVPVDEFTLPPLNTINQWYPITINKGSALGASIKSVAIYAIVDPGIPTISIDNIIACKAVASADSLTLKSLISKNSAAMGGILGWYGIQSINGTTVMLDNGPLTNADAGQGYSGTTETVATYKRETVTISAVETPMDSGTEGFPIDYQGGFNTATNIQDGETFLDGLIGTINGISISMSWLKMSNLSAVRCAIGVSVANTTNNILSFGSLCNNASNGLNLSSAAYTNIITIRDTCNNTGAGTFISYSFNDVTIINCNSNLDRGVSLTSAVLTRIKCTNSKNNLTYGLYATTSNMNRVIINTANNGTGGVYNDSGLLYLNKSNIEDAVEVVSSVAYGSSTVYSTLHDNTPQNNKVWGDAYTINSQAAVRQTVSGVAWKISPTNVRRNSFYPVVLSIAKIAVDAGSAITVNAFFLRDSLDITGKMVCRKDQLSGLTSDVVSTMSAGINTWEELSVTFTPTESGVVEIEAQVYGGTVNSVYVDSIRMS
jgi:hypothetical protein